MNILRRLTNLGLALWVAAIFYALCQHSWGASVGLLIALVYLFAWALCRDAAQADERLGLK